MNTDKETKFLKKNLPIGVDISIKASRSTKGKDIAVLDLSRVSSFTDFFIIMNGNSTRQNFALYENIEMELKKENIIPLSVEGKKIAEWILMDYGSFIIHIFSERLREYYALEKLWADAPKLSF